MECSLPAYGHVHKPLDVCYTLYNRTGYVQEFEACMDTCDMFVFSGHKQVRYLIRHVSNGIIFLCIGNSQWCLKTLSQNLLCCSTLGLEYWKLIGWYWKIMRRQSWSLTCPIVLMNNWPLTNPGPALWCWMWVVGHPANTQQNRFYLIVFIWKIGFHVTKTLFGSPLCSIHHLLYHT